MAGVRFAPSPTGRFHIGNLRTAWISEKIARALGRPWSVRFEDIDRPRVRGGAREGQLADLKALGLIPDSVCDQSSFIDRHWSLFLKAIGEGTLYPCVCSRGQVVHDLEQMASASHSGVSPAYSGKCRQQASVLDEDRSIGWRFKMPNESGIEDFIVGRASMRDIRKSYSAGFIPSYHWACAIDDMDGAFDVLVRAADLSSAALLQREIQKNLSPKFIAPAIFHTALVVHDEGHRLEKRSVGVTLDTLDVGQVIACFEASFSSDIQNLKKPSVILKEPIEKLKLSELLGK